MPCQSGPSEADALREKARLDAQAHAACQAMRALEKRGLLDAVDKRARDWWEKHRAEDLARIATERESLLSRRASIDRRLAQLDEE